MKIIAIYDNGGETIDRYSVVVDEPYSSKPNRYEMFAVDDNGGHSFSQWTYGNYYPNGNNEHLGRRVHFEDLNEATQRHIAERIFSE